jgi:uncharacterized repeat protein (TIGR04076 family)
LPRRACVLKKVNRREFCQAAVMAGLVFRPLTMGIPLSHGETEEADKGSMIHQEGDMKKKITSITAKVKSQKGTCTLGHRVGDIVTEIRGKICIHALYSMLPAVFAMMYEAHFSWLQDPDTKTHACPDANNPVVFEISRIRES